jgi:hypothetical protein
VCGGACACAVWPKDEPLEREDLDEEVDPLLQDGLVRAQLRQVQIVLRAAKRGQPALSRVIGRLSSAQLSPHTRSPRTIS